MLASQTGLRPGLLVAVLARDPVRRADMAARVALAGHRLAADDGEADVVLADANARGAAEPPLLRLAEGTDDAGSLLPPGLSPTQLDAALRAVAAGLRVSLPGPAPGFAEAEPAGPPLTPRELEILSCLGDGMSNKAVARRLGISAHTVKFHLEAVFAKLAATSRAEAVAKGLRRGLILL